MFDNFIKSQPAFIPVKLFTSDGAPVPGVPMSSVLVTLLKPDGIAPNTNLIMDGVTNNWVEYTFGSFSGQAIYGLTIGAVNINQVGQFVITVSGGGGISTADITVVEADAADAIDELGGTSFTPGTDDLHAIRTKLNLIVPDIATDIPLNENTGGVDNLRYTTSAGDPIIGAIVRVFFKTDYDAAVFTAPVGVTFTNNLGRWANPVFAAPSNTYTIQFQLDGQFGPDVATVVV